MRGVGASVLAALCLAGLPVVHAVAQARTFSPPASFVAGDDHTSFALGSNLFHNGAALMPAGVLGPHFSAASCAACHVADGRGHAYDPARAPRMGKPPHFVDASPALTLRLEAVATAQGGGGYGAQLTVQATPGTLPKGRIQLAYTPLAGRFSDGTPFSLRQPLYRVAEPGYGVLTAGTILSPRVAPQLVGLGLLDAVPEDDIARFARVQQQRGGAVRGRVSQVWDPIEEKAAVGRFGWKAGTASVHHQTGLALQQDMGVTTTRFSGLPCAPFTPCRTDTPEMDDTGFLHLLDYQFGLALPQLPALGAAQQALLQQGKRLFEQAQCGSCHQPVLTTGKGWFPGMSRQTIHPFTDLLLHDMGTALSDRRVDGALPKAAIDGADVALAARSWRTAPLWSIGQIPQVNGHRQLLHDGRARGVLEAILWHGGEAEDARRQVLGMSQAQRDALVAFVNAL